MKDRFSIRHAGTVITGAIGAFSLVLSLPAIAQDRMPPPLRSACEVDYPPFSVVNEGGRADGFSVELMRVALAKIGREVSFRTGTWADVRGWLESGEVDCLPLVGRTPEREALFDFSVSYLTMHGAIVVRKESKDIHSLSSLRGRRVGVMEGDNAEEFLRREDRGFEIVIFATFPAAFRALAQGRCDAMVIQRIIAIRLLDETGLADRLRIVEQPLIDFSQDFCFAARKGDHKTLALLNEGLAAIGASGEYRRLYEKWLGVNEGRALGWRDVGKYVALTAGPLLLIAILALLWSWSLRIQVDNRTRELKESHANLQQREEQYRLLADKTLDVIWKMSPALEFTYVNPAIEPLLGYTPDEWCCSRLSDHCDDAHYAELTSIIRQEVARGAEHQGVVLETELLHKNGSAIQVEVHGRVVFDANGSPIYLQGVTRDISRRKQAEEALRQREEKFSRIFEDHAAVKLIIDPETGDILEANKAAAAFYGWPVETLRRMNVSQINVLSDEEIRSEMQRAKSLNKIHFEFKHRKANGDVVDVEVFSSGVMIGGRTLLHSIIQDITKLKKAEEEKDNLQSQLHQAQKMESVGRLAGGVAHDFNNMLMGIMGYVELCRDRIGLGHPAHEWLDEIMHGAERSANLTRQLLAFARKQTVMPQVVDLNNAVGNMLKMLRRLIGEDIDLIWEPGAGLWPVKIDPGQIDQILANLCINSRDAIKGTGKVKLETENASIDRAYCKKHAEAIPGKYVVLAVSDDGCGMPPEILANLFEPFFTTKPVGKGTGLGLATVYGIVKQNEGFVNVSSELGKGTTFRIYLPRFTGKQEEQVSKEVPTKLTGGNETILLLEDEQGVRVTTARFLEQLGYRVLVAETPENALQQAGAYAGAINLLVTDVVMPGMSGCDVVRTLSASNPAMRVLYISGYTADIIAPHGILDNDVAFLAKPFSRVELSRKVREVLASLESETPL